MPTRIAAFLFQVVLAEWAVSMGIAQVPLHDFAYHEGFEGQPPAVELWATNGKATVNFLGSNQEQAFEGKQSLKLDVTIDSGDYFYWGVRVRAPCAGKLKLSARVLVAPGNTAHVGFGTNVLFPPSPHSGCGAIERFEKPTGGWKLVEVDLVAQGRSQAETVMANHTATVAGDEVGVMLDRWSLFITGRPGQRAVVYLDDVRIEGQTPGQQDFDTEVARCWTKSQERLRSRLEAWRAELAATRQALPKPESLPSSLQEALQSARHNAARAEGLLAKIAKKGLASRAEVDELETTFRGLRYAPETLRAVAANQAAHRPYLLFTPRAITNDRFDIAMFPPPFPVGKELACSGCRGEYEALSAAAYAMEDLRQFTVSATDLTGPGGTIPAAAVDVRVVKWWYQAGREIWDVKHRLYVPELLLKDDDLVRVDTIKKDNLVRTTSPDGKQAYLLASSPTGKELEGVQPRDAATLQPVDVPARSLKQFWFTVHIPGDAKPGVYQGTIKFKAGEGSQELPLKVTVHPFELVPSRLIYSIYYRGVLSKDGAPTITSERKAEAQYRAEMADLQSHGVLYPTNYMGMDKTLLSRAMEIRKEVGLPAGPFYTLGQGAGATSVPQQLESIQRQVKQWIEFCRERGYGPVYFYGTDEATGEQLLAQKAAWGAVQAAGGKTFVACYKKTFEAMGGLLNCAVLAGKPDPEEARKWHSVGSHAFCYAYPQVGNEEPETYRRNFGLALWKAGFDGAMDYAYQHGFGHVWNDFDDKTYRDHNFAYPTVDGVIDTIQWEGFREAVDDVRYASTLAQRIEQAKAKPQTQALAAEAQQWLDKIDTNGDLDAMRVKMVEWILRLEPK